LHFIVYVRADMILLRLASVYETKKSTAKTLTNTLQDSGASGANIAVTIMRHTIILCFQHFKRYT